MIKECSACKAIIDQDATGEPYLSFKNIILCSDCYITLIPKIYSRAGAGDGGIIHVYFKVCLETNNNRSRRIPVKRYRTIFKTLLHKYNFQCVKCGMSDIKKLTIDHVYPVSKGGTDDYNNLQILCKSCNSRKGAKLEVV